MRRLSAGLGVLSLALLAVAHASWSPPPGLVCPPTPADPAEARALAGSLFGQASDRGQAGDWSGSQALFACSYVVFPHPNTLFNVGLAAEHAGDLETAEAALAGCLEDAPAADFAAQAIELLAGVRARPPPAEEDAADGDDDAGGAPPATDAGLAETTEPDAFWPPADAAVETPVAAADAGREESAAMSAWETAGWSLLGTGLGVALLGGGTFSGLAAAERSGFDDVPADSAWSVAELHADRYRLYSDVAIASAAVGGVAALLGAALLLFEPESPPPLLPAAALLPDGVGLAVVGRF
jgi:hypothetical protein